MSTPPLSALRACALECLESSVNKKLYAAACHQQRSVLVDTALLSVDESSRLKTAGYSVETIAQTLRCATAEELELAGNTTVISW